MGHQLGGVRERLAAHGTLAGGEGPPLLRVALHVPVDGHLGTGLEVAKAALELLDRDLVHRSNMLFQQPSVFSDVTTLSALVRRPAKPLALLSVNMLDVNVHVLLAGALVVAVRASVRLDALVDRVFVSNQVTTIGKALLTFFAGPRPQLFMDHLDMLHHVGLLVKAMSALK